MRYLNLPLVVCAACAVLSGGESPKAVAPSRSHDFGQVRRGDTVAHTFTLRNAGEAPLTFRNPTAMSPGLRLSLPPGIAPGAEGTIAFQWNTAASDANATAGARIGTNDPSLPELAFSLSAKVISPIEFQPMPAAFFSVYQGEAAEKVVKIQNNETRPLHITGITPQGTHFQAETREVVPGTLTELRVRVPSGIEPGRFREAVLVHTDHPSYPSLRIPVNVLVKTEVYVSREAVQFGRVSLNQLKAAPGMIDLLTQTFLVKVQRGTLALRSLECDVPGLKVTQTPPSGPAEVFRIDVALDRNQLSPRPLTGWMKIRTSHPRFPELRVRVEGELR